MNRPGKSAASASASVRSPAGSQAQTFAMPVATISRSLPASCARRRANAALSGLPPPTQADVNPARSMAAAVDAGSTPIRSGGGIQIPTRPSRERSSSVVMSTDISTRPGFIPGAGHYALAP